MTIIDDDQELARILENSNLDEYELIDVPIEQYSDSTQDNLGTRMSPISDTNSTSGLAPCKGSSRELRHGVHGPLSGVFYDDRRLVDPSSLSHSVAATRGVHVASTCHDELRTRGTNGYVIIERRGRSNHALGPPSIRRRWLRSNYSRTIRDYSSITPDSAALPIIPKIIPT